MTQTKVKQAVEKWLKEHNNNFQEFQKGIDEYCQFELLEDLTQELENQGVISYGIASRNTNFDSWLQAEVGAEINGKFVGIIFDYDVAIDVSSIDSLTTDLLGYNKRAKEIIKALTVKPIANTTI